MKCVGIIWNCAFEYKDEIINMMSNYSVVENWSCINLNSNYEKFVRLIYSADSIAEWKIDKKVEYMQNYPSTSVCIVYFDIDTSALRYHEKKKHMVYANLQDLKDLIRKTYSHKLPFYFFDIIFHCSESIEEYEADNEIINMFL